MQLERWLSTVPLRLRSLFRGRQVDQELDEELRYHVDRKTDEYIARGLSSAQARAAALRDMGGLEQRKEECRDVRRVNGIEHVVQDVRYGLRVLAKSPTFTAVAVLTLALGIGASTAIFSVINAVLLEALPYPDPDRIVQLVLFSPAWAPDRPDNIASVPEFVVYREQREAFQEVAAYDSRAKGINLTGIDPEQLRALRVSAGYFHLFGATLEVGRAFTEEEDRPNGPRVVVITHALWQRRFGADPTLVGNALVLGGEPYTVIGVLRPGFASVPSAEVLLPMQADPFSTNNAHTIRVAARLAPGVTLEMAKAQMKLAHEQFQRKFPTFSMSRAPHDVFTAEPLWEATVGDVRRPLLVLIGAVSCVLLIACTNVANLLIARGTGRRHEIAIRAALGASRRRILAQLLTEAVLLSLAGGAVGLLVGSWGLRALTTIGGHDIPRIGDTVTVDWRMVAFALLLSVAAGLLFGILPGLSRTAAEPAAAALNEAGTRIGAGVSTNRTRSMLVTAEIALAVVLLAGAGLLIRTFWGLRTVDPGFDSRNVLVMEMSLAGTPFRTAPALAQLIRNAERRVESLPGVIALAATYSLPLENQLGGPVTIEAVPNDAFGANQCLVSPHYFDVFRIPVRHGRPFTDRDDERDAAVALINQAMAEGRSGEMKWTSTTSPWKADPLHQRITMGKTLSPALRDRTREIVGVAGEVRDVGLGKNPTPTVYVPIAQLTDAMATFISGDLPITWAIRTSAEPHAFSASVERELRAVSGGLPVARVRSMEQVVTDSTARTRFEMVLLTVFAAVALLLAAIGVYGSIAYAVQHRTREIGIRIALGASPQRVRTMVVFEGMRPAMLGVVLGLGGALALTPLMTSLLYGVRPSNPLVLTLVVVLLTSVALFAMYIPARRVTRVDPVLALRCE